MMAVVWDVLSILGMILLALFILALVLLLAILFYPITYRVFGKKTEDKTILRIRALWLFGLLRIQYDYPGPEKLRIKLLWKTLFDSAKEGTGKASGKESSSSEGSSSLKEGKSPEEGKDLEASASPGAGKVAGKGAALEGEQRIFEAAGQTDGVENPFRRIKSCLLEKYEKIVYTFRRIYDKIKHIWHNISCYKEILSERETAALFAHAKKRLGKIFRLLRPKRIRATVLFGTGSPDTTGYAYGVYGMLLPGLGKNVLVTPDFTRAVLQGEIKAGGHVALGRLLWHGGRLALDKRLHLLISRLKAVQPLKNGGENGR